LKVRGEASICFFPFAVERAQADFVLAAELLSVLRAHVVALEAVGVGIESW